MSAAAIAAVPRVARRIPRRALTIALAAAALVIALPYAPAHLGGSMSYVIVAGQSMEPTLDHGDFVGVERQRTYRRGDVVAYRVPAGELGAGTTVIHRIVGGSAKDGFVLRGDNRSTDDMWRPKPDDITGRLRVHVGATSRVLGFLGSPVGLGVFAALLAAFVLVPWVRPRG